MANNSGSYFIFLLLVFVLAISEIAIVKGKICEKPSKTWFGECKDSEKCDKKCIEWEGAMHGACHEREAKYMCFCYFDCDPKKNPGPPAKTPPSAGGEGDAPPPGIPAPPNGDPPAGEGGGAPPPAEGGGAPPPAEGGGGGGGGAPPA
ncbi:anther-specific protein SF18-like [Bidens hawaiensis]|uniref:anther-specific protein SF18-like n=1 Tax=Bidens hawaiensis TaxID=980011 RepID=UPI00404A5A9E